MADDADRFRKGVELLKKGSLEEAIGELEVAATTGEDLPIEHFALAVAYAKSGDARGGLREFERFLSMGPKDEKKIDYARKKIAKLQAKLDSQEREGAAPTQELAQAFAGPDPTSEPGPVESLQSQADAALAEGRIDEALNLYEKSLAESSKDAAAWSGLGKATFRKGIQGAISAFERAASLDPKNGSPLYNLGMLALLIADRDRARKAFQAALERDPNDAESRRQLSNLGG